MKCLVTAFVFVATFAATFAVLFVSTAILFGALYPVGEYLQGYAEYAKYVVWSFTFLVAFLSARGTWGSFRPKHAAQPSAQAAVPASGEASP